MSEESPDPPSRRPLRILLVEDDPDDVVLTRRLLDDGIGRARELLVDCVSSVRQAEGVLQSRSFDVVLLDYRLPGEDGLALLNRMEELRLRTPGIVLTGRGDETLVTEAIRSGASDYLPKEGLTPSRLAASIRHARELRREMTARREAEEALATLRSVESITDAALSRLELEELLEELLGRLRETLEVDGATLLLRSPEGAWLREEATAGPLEIDHETRIPFGRGLAGRVAARGPMTFGDVSAEHEVFRPRIRDRVASLLAVPVMSEGQVMGVLEMDTLEPREFTGRDRLVLQVVADRVAPAIARARLLRELRQARGRLQGLSRALLSLQERERGRLARELHDEVGQELTALKLGLESNREILREAGRSGDFQQMMGLVARLQSQVRSLSRGLRPPALDTLGLEPALVELFDQITGRTDVEIDYRLRGDPGSLRPPARIAAYRIVQEALTNAVRHAGVDRVEVEVSQEGGVFEVRIRDRGKGFDPSASRLGGSGGLAGMRERAELESGELRVKSRPGEGTTIVARLPLETGRESEE